MGQIWVPGRSKDLTEEHAKRRLPYKEGYEWVDPLIGIDKDMVRRQRNQLVKEAKKARETLVPNLKGPQHQEGCTPKQHGVDKDRRKLKVELLGQASSSGSESKAFDLGGLKSSVTVMRKGMKIGLKENELKIMEETELVILIRALLEFHSRSLVLYCKVANLLQKKMVNGKNTKNVEELASMKKKYDDDKHAWAEEKCQSGCSGMVNVE
ncbi:hypothetical protein V8G54_010020 [Vigna mungo]|uniref:Uncharacterized protein n=1 Tax=Vigna mungo TaxID=3915 RepID=A0AAQ3NWT2_VIGMU